MNKPIMLFTALALLVGCGKKDDKTAQKESGKAAIEVVDTSTLKPEKVYPKRYTYQYDELLQSQSESERWATYKTNRAESKTNIDNGELKAAIDNLLLAGETTVKLNRPDIAAWQFNNAAKCAIDLFSKNVSYQSRVAKINRMPIGDEKTEYMKECQNAYAEDLELLIYGKLYLELAESLNEEEYDRGRANTISNNKEFIKEVLSFSEKEF